MAGGSNPVQVQPAMGSAMSAPRMVPQPNVFQQSAQGLTGAMQGAQAGMNFQPQQIKAQQAVGGIGAYMNPYTQQVIDRSMADLERTRQMQMNDLGAQATRAGAFGGSRQGVAEALTNQGFARQAGDLAAQLRAQGFNTALGAAQQDVATNMQAQLANQGAGLNAAQMRQGAAGLLGNLSQQGFNMGQAITGQQMQQGQMQQALNQALISAAQRQFQGFTGAPSQALQLPLAAVSAANMGQQTSTQQNNPGFLGTLGGLLSIF